jgi:hypothetical protein
MFLPNQKGPENIPAIVAEGDYDRQFLSALDACMTKQLGCGLDRPDAYRIWVPVPKGIPAEKFSFTAKLHSSFAAEAADFCFTLRSVGGDCTDPVENGEELSFTMTIHPSNAKMSPVGDGCGVRIRMMKFRQVPCPW